MDTLRDYQNDIVEDTRSSIAQGHEAPCVVSPTGSGKTIIMAHLTAATVDKGNSVLVLAPRRELVHQTSEKPLSNSGHARFE